MVLLEDLGLYRNGVPHAVYDQVRAEQPVYDNKGQHHFFGVLSHFGPFVDDGAFALAITIWVGVIWLVLPQLKAPTALGGVISSSVWR